MNWPEFRRARGRNVFYDTAKPVKAVATLVVQILRLVSVGLPKST
jgi:hypothetical protein